MPVLFTVQRITSDGRGLLLEGALQGGSLEPGDHLALPAGSGDHPHLHVLHVDGDDHGATIAVDAASTAMLDVHTVLTRVVPLPPTALLPMTGMPPGVDHDDHPEPHGAPLPLDPDETAGSGPGYDPFK